MFRNPEKTLNNRGQGNALLLPLPGLLLQPQIPEHPRQNLAGLRMQEHGGQAARIPNIGRSHPRRVALLPPVQHGRFPLHQAARGRKHLFIPHACLFHHSAGKGQPVGIPRQAVNFPRSHPPHHTVGRNGPGTARAGILLHLPVPDPCIQTVHTGTDIPQPQSQMGGIGNIPGPHSRPVGSRPERSFFIKQGSSLMQRQAVSLIKHFKISPVMRGVPGFRNNAPLGIAAVFHGFHLTVRLYLRPMRGILAQGISGQRKSLSSV